MRFIADFHIHSRYSRACSQELTIPNLDKWADDKGILVMGTGDFTHPEWLSHLETTLEPAEPGLFRVKKEHQVPTLKGTKAHTRFLLTVEISSIYSRAGKTRRIHTILFAPDFATAKKINAALLKAGAKLSSDGRPIVGIDVRDIAKIALEANPESVIIPAHIWTPWFSLFGSMSGFNSLEECFGEFSKYIFAMETGLSSDPAMNWRLSALDTIALISNSDSHSLERIGREANIFETELSYGGIVAALKANNPTTFVATIEYFPEEGKYHFDGHRKCGVCWSAKETRGHRGICTGCGKPVTVGVLNRLDKLADRDEIVPQRVAFQQVMANGVPGRVPYINLVTLDSIIAEGLGVSGTKTKSVKKEYENLIRAFGSELKVLTEVPIENIAKVSNGLVSRGVAKMRAGEFEIDPGYDGEYGVVKIFSAKEKAGARKGTLF